MPRLFVFLIINSCRHSFFAVSEKDKHSVRDAPSITAGDVPKGIGDVPQQASASEKCICLTNALLANL